MRELEEKYKDVDVPIPPYWGGYRLAPDMLEFWQNRPGRLHDRFRYRLHPGGVWLLERLSP
jgi:pyridoxamine 5'-phosphate oxidase